MPNTSTQATEWVELVHLLEPQADELLAMLGDDLNPRLRQMINQQLLGALSDGFHLWVQGDERHPRFFKTWTTAINIAAPNGDTVYHYARIDGRGTYRLSGTFGDALLINLSMGPVWQIQGFGAARGNKNFESLTVGPDRSFSVILSAERPEGYTGDWWPLADDHKALGLREVFYHWGGAPTRVAIERLDLAPPLSSLDPEARGRRVTELASYVKNETSMWIKHVNKIFAEHTANEMFEQSYGGGSGLPGQAYYEGVFEFGQDEALILEVIPPKDCVYWSVLLADRVFSTIDWVNHQSSLNGSQARLDQDGAFRAVVSHRDPGVPNWLDTDGNQKGIIQGRWLGCSGGPLPSLRKVPLDQIRRYLPGETPVVDAQTRSELLNERCRTAQLSGIG